MLIYSHNTLYVRKKCIEASRQISVSTGKTDYENIEKLTSGMRDRILYHLLQVKFLPKCILKCIGFYF